MNKVNSNQSPESTGHNGPAAPLPQLSSQPPAQHHQQPEHARQDTNHQPAPVIQPATAVDGSQESVPVVKVWSIRGVEYAIMTFMLWMIAISLTWVPITIIVGFTGFAALSPPLALLIVSLPIFAVFFMRLKKAELQNPSLRTESTKRRFSQITQVVSFIICFTSLLTIVTTVLALFGGESADVAKTISSALVFLVVWGGLFIYYWRDERKF